jgi:hypothetical protein
VLCIPFPAPGAARGGGEPINGELSEQVDSRDRGRGARTAVARHPARAVCFRSEGRALSDFRRRGCRHHSTADLALPQIDQALL